MKDKIVIQNISKSYNKKPVLSDISIEVSQGESIGLFGPNGAGKSTLFAMLLRFYQHQARHTQMACALCNSIWDYPSR